MTRHGTEGKHPELDVLNDIYALYDRFSEGLPVACERGCCVCCTQDVTITTWEGRQICQSLAGMEKSASDSLIEDIQQQIPVCEPPISTNTFARRCLGGHDPPTETQNLHQGRCVFLSGTDCLIYPDRPFGCRSFFSTQTCRSGGAAVMTPFILTVNGIFLQFIEDLDVGGLFGPMNSVLSFLVEEGLFGLSVPTKRPQKARGAPLAPNDSIPALMVPPEHEARVRPLIHELRAIRQKCRPGVGMG
jgi:hypothetical protein